MIPEHLIQKTMAALEEHRPSFISPQNYTPAAVLLPMVVSAEDPSGLDILFVERKPDPGPHGGQIAFPGGKLEPGESAVMAACREASEEIGLQSEHYRMLGRLDDSMTMTGFVVSAFVAAVSPLHPPWQLAETEIESLFTVPWPKLVDTSAWGTMTWQRDGVSFTLPCFVWNGHTIWGLTAKILIQLIGLVEGIAIPPS
jgi:8-oxo-dGTP pyrophosphatase MutT (NUDIX family)